MAREFAKKFYKSKEWMNVRQGALMRDKYLCVKCGRPAEEVHHIIHLSPANIYDPNITLNLENLQSLCTDCHFAEHKADRKVTDCSEEYEFDENGYIVPAVMRNCEE